MRFNQFQADAVFAGELEAKLGFRPIVDIGSGRPVAWDADGATQALDRACIERAVATAVRAGLLEGDAWLALLLPATAAPGETAAHLFCTAIAHGIPAQRLLAQICAEECCNVEQAAALARACRDHGMKIALDGFSAGPQGMRLLAQAKPRWLKLDPALTCGLSASASRRRIVEGVLRLARTLGVTVIAPRCTSSERKILQALGVTLFEGDTADAQPPRPAPPGHMPRQPPTLHAV